jgi:DegV family protein with EDD domain
VGQVPIYSVPLNVIWGEENLKDGVDITVEQFYERLNGAKVMPSTSQPSPKEFLDMFKPLLNEGFEIFCMLISDQLSGTVNSAVQAKSMLGDVPVIVFDTQSASLGMDLQINVVAKAINDGATLEELLPIAESARARTKVYFTVETLEFLIRGGRLSFVQGAAGTLLQIRPLLTLEEGKIVSMSKTRTFKKAVTALVDQVISDVEGKTLENIAGAYTNNDDFVHKTMHRVCDEIGVPMPDENLMMPLSPVIGTHTGPGAFGIAYMLGE